MSKEVYSHIDYKDELLSGRKYKTAPLMKGIDRICVINESGQHEFYCNSWFKSYPPSICTHEEYFDSINVDSELMGKVEARDKVLKYL